MVFSYISARKINSFSSRHKPHFLWPGLHGGIFLMIPHLILCGRLLYPQLPNVFGKFGPVLVFFVVDWFRVVPESCLKFVGCNPDVCFRFVIVSCCYVSFLYYISLKAVSLHWALVVTSAVAEAWVICAFSCANEFKTRFRNHTKSINNKKIPKRDWALVYIFTKIGTRSVHVGSRKKDQRSKPSYFRICDAIFIALFSVIVFAALAYLPFG